jgi:NAD-dependent dihydropyrimidine dehydrogenase PreA subunit
MKRKIIHIDESKCTGCGLCIPNCAEGSLALKDGKVVLVKEALCDGLGACLGHCPEDALQIEERDAEEFDEGLVERHLQELGRAPHDAPAGGCPSARPAELRTAPPSDQKPAAAGPSELSHWPVQLALLPPAAPFLKGAELLLTADCVPFAYPSFHQDFLKGKAVAVACPKLDHAEAHFRKLVDLFRQSGIRSVTVVRMEVPCCGGLSNMASEALKESGAEIEYREVVIGREGEVVEKAGKPGG